MTLQQHLNDLRWLFFEKGLQHVHNLFKQLATATVQGNITGANAIGAIELDAATNPGLTAALVNTVNPSGQLFPTSPTLEFSSSSTIRVPPSQFR